MSNRLPEFKTCRGPCERTLPYDDFPKALTRGKWYAKSRCRDCLATKQGEWRSGHPGYYDGILHFRAMARKLGIDPDAVEVLYRESNGRCDICNRTPDEINGWFKHLSVDHCHDKLIARGFLCNPCNRALGLMGDDPDRLEAAARYLRKHKGGGAL